ncbi:hypothetical protein WJX72_006252 [[Myrmecia] bisecta]|uniref:Cytochrome b6-f complex subunit 7 n=1 Tax=[Myrmecia] bisecta TaxID=41462 RepID=A0AAW1QQS8_9CHLO
MAMFSGLKRQGGVFSSPKSVDEKFVAMSRSVRGPLRGKGGALQAVSAMEVAQIAGEAGYIGGTAAVMFAMTLVGLAVGFVLLRVESLVEEGEL